MLDFFGIFALFSLLCELIGHILAGCIWVLCIFIRVIVGILFFWVPRE